MEDEAGELSRVSLRSRELFSTDNRYHNLQPTFRLSG
jgi:hypothetical protein